MITPEVFFKNLKEIYNVAFDNFNVVSSQQKKFIDLWLSQQPESFKEPLTKAIDEWFNNVTKGMNDFKEIVLSSFSP